MFGKVLTYDAYHLALYLLTASLWGLLGLRVLLRGTGGKALAGCCGLFAVALLINGVMLVLDTQRVLEHHQVEMILLMVGVALPGALMCVGVVGRGKVRKN